MLGLSACIESRVPKFSRPLQLGDRMVSAAVLNQGDGLYHRYCSRCHGSDGSGNGPQRSGAEHKPTDFRTGQFAHAQDSNGLASHQELVGIIRNGIPNRGMPAWPGLSESDIDALADYIKTMSPRWKQP